LAFGHYENFPVASLLLPQPQRDGIAAIYAFARSADDFADEAEFEGRRQGLLEDWMARLEQPADGHPVFTALHDAIQRWDLSKAQLRNLVQAFIVDLSKTSYEDQEDLYGYCRLSANPVGRLVLRVFGQDSEENLKDSDAICTALQLANHWQDLGRDLRERKRCYLPKSTLERYRIQPEELEIGSATFAVRMAIQEQVNIADALFARGEGLCRRLPGRLGLEIRLTVAGGRRILAKIREADYNTLLVRPKLGTLDAMPLLWTALLGRTQ
jgi:phytoene synthase